MGARRRPARGLDHAGALCRHPRSTSVASCPRGSRSWPARSRSPPRCRSCCSPSNAGPGGCSSSSGSAWRLFASAFTPPADLPAMEHSHLANVTLRVRWARSTIIHMQGPYHDDMLGLEHWLYCLGMRDARSSRCVQLGDPGRTRARFVLGLPAPCRAQGRAAARHPALRLLVHLPVSPQLRRRHPGASVALLRGSGKGTGSALGSCSTRPCPPDCSWCSTSHAEDCCCGSPTGRVPAVFSAG